MSNLNTFCRIEAMDEVLRRIERSVSEAEPVSFLVACRAYERAGMPAQIFSDLLERLLIYYEAIYKRAEDSFEIAWYRSGSVRGWLHFRFDTGGIIHFYTSTSTIFGASRRTASHLFQTIFEGRLALPTAKLTAILEQAISANHVSEIRNVACEDTHDRIRRCFDVVTKRDLKRPWREDYHLRFELVRSVYRDLLEVSVEDVLGWGTEHEVQGLRLTGTSFTIYGGEQPEYEPPGEEFTTYEVIDRIDGIPALVNEIFHRFRHQL